MTDHVVLERWDGDDTTLPARALTWMQTTDGNVAIACGQGHIAFLDPAHQIADDGSITPSLGCPEEGCDWHVFGRLEGWEARF